MGVMPTVLLIDDDPDFVEATCAVLESLPCQVLLAYNGEEGLAKAKEARPDLIILDVIMPGEDGFQTLEKIKADATLAPIPVIIMTSLVNGLAQFSGNKTIAAIEAYIDKPIKPVELLRRIEKLLEQRNT